MRCPPDLVCPVVVPMYCTCEDEEYDRKVDPAECIFPRIRPWILLARGDQPWGAAARYLDLDPFCQFLERYGGYALRDEGSQERHDG